MQTKRNEERPRLSFCSGRGREPPLDRLLWVLSHAPLTVPGASWTTEVLPLAPVFRDETSPLASPVGDSAGGASRSSTPPCPNVDGSGSCPVHLCPSPNTSSYSDCPLFRVCSPSHG